MFVVFADWNDCVLPAGKSFNTLHHPFNKRLSRSYTEWNRSQPRRRPGGSPGGNTLNARHATRLPGVAQIFNLLYRRIVFGRVSEATKPPDLPESLSEKERGCVEDQPQHAANSPAPGKIVDCCVWSRTTQPRSGIFRQPLSAADYKSAIRQNKILRYILCVSSTSPRRRARVAQVFDVAVEHEPVATAGMRGASPQFGRHRGHGVREIKIYRQLHLRRAVG